MFLVEDVGVHALKIASGDLTFTPLLTYAARTGIPLILSTGGATEIEVCEALAIINQRSGRNTSAFCDQVALLHCRSIYPCADIWTNLRVIQCFQKNMRVGAVGWSDHTVSTDLVPALAVAMGATVIEKHLCLEGDIMSVDASHSLSPRHFAAMVRTVRAVPCILGNGEKQPHRAELHDRLWARRSPTDWLRPTDEARAGRWA